MLERDKGRLGIDPGSDPPKDFNWYEYAEGQRETLAAKARARSEAFNPFAQQSSTSTADHTSPASSQRDESRGVESPPISKESRLWLVVIIGEFLFLLHYPLIGTIALIATLAAGIFYDLYVHRDR